MRCTNSSFAVERTCFQEKLILMRSHARTGLHSSCRKQRLITIGAVLQLADVSIKTNATNTPTRAPTSSPVIGTNRNYSRFPHWHLVLHVQPEFGRSKLLQGCLLRPERCRS